MCIAVCKATKIEDKLQLKNNKTEIHNTIAEGSHQSGRVGRERYTVVGSDVASVKNGPLFRF